MAHAVAHKYEPRPGSLRGRHIFVRSSPSNSTTGTGTGIECLRHYTLGNHPRCTRTHSVVHQRWHRVLTRRSMRQRKRKREATEGGVLDSAHGHTTRPATRS